MNNPLITPLRYRQGNKLPPTANQDVRVTPDRESMLYSYQNSVESSYVGDIRHYAMKFGEYLQSKNKYFDVAKNEYVEFPIRYAAPNLAFSSDKGINDSAKEASIKDRIILPIISYYMTGMERDEKRAIDPCLRYFYKPDKNDPSRVWVTTAPRATNYNFQVDVWTETRESFYQLITAFQLDFNPYSYLTDIYNFEDETQKTFYLPYAKMELTNFSDASNFIPGTDRRVVRGTLQITVEGFLTQPPKNIPYIFNTIYSVGLENATSANQISSGTTASVANVPSINNSNPYYSQPNPVSTGNGTSYNSSYTTNIGDDHSTLIDVVHNLNTEEIIVGCWEIDGNVRNAVDCNITIITANNVQVEFTTAPALNSINIVIVASNATVATGEYTTKNITIDQGIQGVAAPGDTLDTALTNLAESGSMNVFTIRLAQALPAGSLFRIVNNQAYKVTSLDSILPSIDGITLTAGILGNIVSAGRDMNMEYALSHSIWPSTSLLYLSQTGTLTTTVPSAASGDVYSIIVGKSIEGTTSFIFNPTSPMKLT